MFSNAEEKRSHLTVEENVGARYPEIKVADGIDPTVGFTKWLCPRVQCPLGPITTPTYTT